LADFFSFHIKKLSVSAAILSETPCKNNGLTFYFMRYLGTHSYKNLNMSKRKRKDHPSIINRNEEIKEKKSTMKRKIAGVALIITGLIIIGFIGFFLMLKIFSAPRIANLLPLKDTIALVETDISGINGQFDYLLRLTQDSPAYSKENFINHLYEKYEIDFYKEISPWIGGRHGAALIKGGNEINEVYFIESRDHDQTLEFLKKYQMTHPDDAIVASNYRGYDIYSYKMSNNLKFFFAKKYLIISNQKEPLQQIINVLTHESDSLDSSRDYRTIITNTNRDHLAFAYLDVQNGLGYIVKNPKYAKMLGREISLYMPLLKIYKQLGVSISAEGNGIKVQTYTSVDKESLKDNIYFRYDSKYNGKLLSHLPENPLSVFGGHNLSSQLQRFESLLGETNSLANILYRGEINKFIKMYLGEGIDYEKDILPIFANEYLYFLEGSFSSPDYALILEINDETNLKKLLPKFEQAFIKIAANRNPITKEIELADGTKAEEIVVDFNDIKKEEMAAKNANIISFKTSGGKELISYAINDNKFIFTTKISTLNNILEKTSEPDQNSEIHQKIDKNIISSADEIGYVDLESFWPSGKFLSPEFLEYLLPFKKVYFGQEIFDNGTVAEYYFEVK